MINYTDITADMQISLDIVLESVGILMGYEQEIHMELTNYHGPWGII